MAANFVIAPAADRVHCLDGQIRRCERADDNFAAMLAYILGYAERQLGDGAVTGVVCCKSDGSTDISGLKKNKCLAISRFILKPLHGWPAVLYAPLSQCR